MSPATRERILQMALPAALLTALWLGIFRRMLSNEQDAVQKELAAAVAAEPKDVDFAMANNRLAAIRKELDKVKQEHAEWDLRWEGVQQDRSTHSSQRVATIEQVTHLFERVGLKLVSEAPAEGSSSARLTPTLDQVASRIAKPRNTKGPTAAAVATKPHLWRVHFNGSYADVVEALELLNDECRLAIPVQLTMDQPKGRSRFRSWTLLLWL